MRPPHWQPACALSPAEEVIVARIKRATLFVFLRRVRQALFDAAFQDELATIFRESAEGACPVPPAQLALVVILQAYTGASDDEAIAALTMDRRWQLMRDCLDCDRAPFGTGTLVRFRAALIAHDLDRRLSSAPSSWPGSMAAAARASGARRSIAARCGAPGGSRTPTTSWATPSARRWA